MGRCFQRGAAFSRRKWSRTKEVLYLVRSTLTQVLWSLKPGGWAPLQAKWAPAARKRELLLVRNEEIPNQRGAYIGKRYSVTIQRGVITGQQGRRRRSYVAPCQLKGHCTRLSGIIASQTGAYIYKSCQRCAVSGQKWHRTRRCRHSRFKFTVRGTTEENKFPREVGAHWGGKS